MILMPRILETTNDFNWIGRWTECHKPVLYSVRSQCCQHFNAKGLSSTAGQTLVSLISTMLALDRVWTKHTQFANLLRPSVFAYQFSALPRRFKRHRKRFYLVCYLLNHLCYVLLCISFIKTFKYQLTLIFMKEYFCVLQKI